jgi:thiol-disulfide isomerase/thioredoxin
VSRSGPPRGLRRRLLSLAGVVAIVGVTIAILIALGLFGRRGGGEGIENVDLLKSRRAPGQESLEVGPQAAKLAPDFEISSFDGVRYRMGDFRGKTVYVNFWATWCAPCRAELPDIYAFQRKHPDDLVVITVNRRQSLDEARGFLAGLPRLDGGNGVSFGVDGIDPDDTLYREYRALGMPASFFIDPQGVVSTVANGRISLEQMEDALSKATVDS